MKKTMRSVRPIAWLGAATRPLRNVLSWFLLGLTFALSGCGDLVDLQAGLKDSEANEIVTVLKRHGVEAQKRPSKEGIAIVIDKGDLSRATDALQAAGLPRRTLSNLGQVFKKEGMISTPLEERVRYIYGLSEELQYTLQQFDHVVSARVHVVLPERIAPGEPIQPSSAAVFVKYHPPFDEDTATPKIRNLVSSSIPGLSGEDGRSKVSVVLVPSDIVAPPMEWKSVGPFRIQADSYGSFIALLVVMTLVTLASLGFAGIMKLKYDPKVHAWVRSKMASINMRAAKKREAAG